MAGYAIEKCWDTKLDMSHEALLIYTKGLLSQHDRKDWLPMDMKQWVEKSSMQYVNTPADARGGHNK